MNPLFVYDLKVLSNPSATEFLGLVFMRICCTSDLFLASFTLHWCIHIPKRQTSQKFRFNLLIYGRQNLVQIVFGIAANEHDTVTYSIRRFTPILKFAVELPRYVAR